MEKRTVLIILAIIVLLSGIIFFRINYIVKNAPSTNLAECKTYSYADKGAYDIVFFASKEQVQKNVDEFLNTAPYKDNKNKFNFYYIDSYKPNCTLYQGIALFCNSKELVKVAGSCPNDFIVVLSDAASNIRSSSYQNVLSINSKHPETTFLHEFGHAFADLDDEYVPASLSFSSKNCFGKCDAFGTGVEGCYGGCGKDNYYRSIDFGLMRTLSTSDYGSFDKGVIVKILDKRKTSLISFRQIDEPVNCENSKYYLVSGTFGIDNVTINAVNSETGCAGLSDAGSYNYSLLTQDGNKILQAGFNANKIFTDLSGTGEVLTGGSVLNSGNEFLLRIPYSAGDKFDLAITDEFGNEVARTKLSETSNVACRIK